MRGKRPTIRVMFLHTRHTTEKDAERVGEQIRKFAPDIISPMVVTSEQKRLKEEGRELRLLRGEEELSEEIQSPFSRRLLDIEREYFKEKEPRVFMLETAGGRKERGVQQEAFQQAKHGEKGAEELFEQNRTNEALAELEKSLMLRRKAMQMRYEWVKKNVEQLPQKLFERYPELKGRSEIRVVHITGGPHTLPYMYLRKEQRGGKLEGLRLQREFPAKSHAFLTKSKILRQMLFGRSVDKREFIKVLIENTLERGLRKAIPNSEKRFDACMKLAEEYASRGASYPAIQKDLAERGSRIWKTAKRYAT